MDPTLLERIGAGDATAVDECIDRYGGLVWSLAHRHLRQHADAEDAVQEIFIEIVEECGPLRSPDCLGGHVHHHDRPPASDRPPAQAVANDCDRPMEEDVVAGSQSQQDRIDGEDDAERARQFMGKLRTVERQVLELALFEGLSQSQISEAAGLPLGTVKTHARRGLMRLRQMLEADLDPSATRGTP